MNFHVYNKSSIHFYGHFHLNVPLWYFFKMKCSFKTCKYWNAIALILDILHIQHIATFIVHLYRWYSITYMAANKFWVPGKNYSYRFMKPKKNVQVMSRISFVISINNLGIQMQSNKINISKSTNRHTIFTASSQRPLISRQLEKCNFCKRE